MFCLFVSLETTQEKKPVGSSSTSWLSVSYGVGGGDTKAKDHFA